MSNSGLIVRRSERFEISIPGKVRVAMAHVDQVQFAKGVGDDNRWIKIDIVDFGEGGVGFVSESFFARGLNLEIEIPEIGDPNGEAMIQCEMSVKRVQMTDRNPTYLIGCAFSELNEESRKAVESMIQQLLNMSDQDESEGSHNA
ncbi:MAG: PilZ domain-containing protein [Phycisphaerales bacterium]|nr:PilZ domain-containing protein [Phycisphaerales bacterium]